MASGSSTANLPALYRRNETAMQAEPHRRRSLGTRRSHRVEQARHGGFALAGNETGRLGRPSLPSPCPPRYSGAMLKRPLGDSSPSRGATRRATRPHHHIEVVIVLRLRIVVAAPAPAFLRRRRSSLGNDDLAAEMAPGEDAHLDGFAPHELVPAVGRTRIGASSQMIPEATQASR